MPNPEIVGSDRRAQPDADVPVVLALLAIVLVVWLVLGVPAGSNAFWGVNGLRSVRPEAVVLVLLSLVASLVWATRPGVPGAALAVAGALALAWPLGEAGHFLGDTWVRWRTLDAAASGVIGVQPFALLARQMHAQPLDNLLGLWGPVMLAHAGIPPAWTLGVVALGLALLYFTALSGIARQVSPEGADTPFVAVLAMAGSLEVFARYAESGGAVLAFGALWWWTLLRPMARRRDAVLSALAWLAFTLAHRIALVALLPQLVRAVAVRFDRDERGPCRDLLVATLTAIALAVAASVPGSAGALTRDWTELGQAFRRLVSPADLANLLAVVTPLALLAPWFAGKRILRDLFRTPLGALHLAAFLPLAPLLFLYPMAPHGLGAHRDWELAVLPGLIATSFAGAALARIEAPRRRGAILLLLPVLVLLAGSWLAVNADDGAVLHRAEVLVTRPFGVTEEQRAHALVYLGYRAADRGDYAAAARWFDTSFEALHNARTTLIAAQCWLRCGELRAARASLARAYSRGDLEGELASVARQVEGMVLQAEGAMTPPRTVP